MTVSHSGIEPTIAGLIMFFITAKIFLVGSDPLPMHKSHRTIFWDLKSLSLVAQVASFSFVSLTGATNSVEQGEVTTQSTLDKMKTRSKLFLT